MNKLRKIIVSVLLIVPTVALAQLSSTKTLIESTGGLVTTLTKVVAGLALLAFFWGLVKFIFAQGNETSKVEAKKIMGWGLIAIFIMVSVWGIVYFIGNELFPGLTNYDAPSIPTFPRP